MNGGIYVAKDKKTVCICVQIMNNQLPFTKIKSVTQTQTPKARRGAGTDQFSFHFSANRFLRGMIRILVAQLLDVGLGKESAHGFEQRLAQNERPPYFRLAPPQGLSLVEIQYPF